MPGLAWIVGLALDPQMRYTTSKATFTPSLPPASWQGPRVWEACSVQLTASQQLQGVLSWVTAGKANREDKQAVSSTPLPWTQPNLPQPSRDSRAPGNSRSQPSRQNAGLGCGLDLLFSYYKAFHFNRIPWWKPVDERGEQRAVPVESGAGAWSPAQKTKDPRRCF